MYKNVIFNKTQNVYGKTYHRLRAVRTNENVWLWQVRHEPKDRQYLSNTLYSLPYVWSTVWLAIAKKRSIINNSVITKHE